MADDEIIILKGSKRTIVFARDAKGACPAGDYFDALPREAQARFYSLFQHMAHSFAPLRGQDAHKLDGTDFEVTILRPGSRKRQKIRKVLHEFKSNADKARLLFFHFDCPEKGLKYLVVCAGCQKKEDKLETGVIARATNTAKTYLTRKASKGIMG
jgi:hypothetical protein